jgi:predicted acyl esterase
LWYAPETVLAKTASTRIWVISFFFWGSPLYLCASEPPSPPAYGLRMEQASIPMKDGVRLAATLYRPDGAKPKEKFPALLEYLPYRKDDGTAAGDYPKHSYFAHRGYVSVRVDIRGFGASEGVPPEREYSLQEQEDGEQVIAWLAHQPWSNGNVGMFGISWGGFTALQMAMRHAPGLKAILAVDATAELFHDDVHYVDGMAHIDEFELNMDMAEGWVGAPDYSLDERVLGPRYDSPPWSLLYLKHQHDGPFWRERVRPLREITTPSFLIGGLLDGYRDNVPDMLMESKAPIKAIVGPWNHTFPNDAVPGPQIEWRDQAVRWFDYWLKGHDTGVLQDPRLIVYMQHWHSPDPNLQTVPGEWRREDVWPPKDVKNTTLFLQPNHGLGDSVAAEATHQLKYVPTIGVEAGFWWGELLSDPRPVDAFSLVYDSAPLPGDIAILGRPHALLQASATAPLADWFARLSDVAPDGAVTQITGAGINGAQRESMSNPRDLEPGKVYPLDIEMHLTSWVFPKGHSIRVAISNALWPMVLPTPYAMTTSLELGGTNGSRLLLPVVPLQGAPAPEFSPPQPSEQRTDIKNEGFPWPGEWTVERDEARQKTTVHWKGKDGYVYPWGTEDDFENLTYEGDDAHPETCSVRGEAESVFALKGRTLMWRGHLLVTTDQKNFYYKYTRELVKDGQMLKSKTWQETIPRDHQ